MRLVCEARNLEMCRYTISKLQRKDLWALQADFYPLVPCSGGATPGWRTTVTYKNKLLNLQLQYVDQQPYNRRFCMGKIINWIIPFLRYLSKNCSDNFLDSQIFFKIARAEFWYRISKRARTGRGLEQRSSRIT